MTDPVISDPVISYNGLGCSQGIREASPLLSLAANE